MRLWARVTGAVLALAFGLGGWAVWGAIRTPVVVRYTQPMTGLQPGARVRVLLLSDTHLGFPDMPQWRLERIMAQANALRPDLILLAGDYIGGNFLKMGGRPHLEPAIEPFAELKAPLGVFAVLGNHDNRKWGPIVFRNQGHPRLLVNEHADVGPLVVAGVTSVAHRADLNKALAGIPADKPVLLLRHEGDALGGEPFPKGRSILALAGHTHGGQVYLPFLGAPGAAMLGHNPDCRRGLCHLNGWPLYVTSGVGTSWLPVRIGVPPELVLITLTGPEQTPGRREGHLIRRGGTPAR